MASLFDRIRQSRAASGIDGALADQVGKLGDAGDLLDNLTGNPPAALAEMATALHGFSLPQIQPLQELLAQVERLRERLPDDPASLTGSLEDELDGLLTGLRDELLGPFAASVASIDALHTLLTGEKEETSAPAEPESVSSPAAVRGLAVGGDAVVGALDQVDRVLDALPSPLTVESALRRIAELLSELPTNVLPTSRIPGVSAFQQSLETTLRWQDLDAADLAETFGDTLRALAQYIRGTVEGQTTELADELAALAPLVPVDELRGPAQGIGQGLAELATVVEGGDLSSVGARVEDLNARVGQLTDRLQTLATDLPGARTREVVGRLSDFPDALDARAREVLRLIKPAGDAVPADDPRDAVDAIWNQAQADTFTVAAEGFLENLRALLADLDLESRREPLLAAIDSARSAVGGLDARLAELTTTVSLLFDEVDRFVDGLDTGAVTASVEDALDDFGNLIGDRIEGLFEPVRSALAEAIDALGAAAGAFDVEQVLVALRNLAGTIEEVLADPGVKATLGSALELLERAARELETFSFRPASDAVIAAIEDLAGALKKIDPAVLPGPARSALDAAASGLPRSIDPLVDRLVDRLDELVEAGPLPFLEKLKGRPERLVAEVEELAPAALIGDRLGAPYDAFLDKLVAFRPSALLAPVEEALEDLRGRVEELRPDRLLQPLDEAHDALLTGVSRLNPTDVVEPLAERITATIDSLLDSLPSEEVFSRIDEVLARVQDLANVGEPLERVLTKLTSALEGISAPDAQVRALVDAILDKVMQIPDAGVLRPAFAAVSDAVTAIRGPQLRALVDNPLGTLTDRLDALDPGPLHGSLLLAQRKFPRAKAEALPPSPERDQILAFLDGFNPLDDVLARPLGVLQDWRAALVARREGLNAFFVQWDELYHDPAGPFAEFVRDEIGASELRDILRDALEPALARPLSLAFQLLERLRDLLTQLLGAVRGLLADLRDRLEELLLVPEAVAALRDAIGELIETMRGFDLSFLVTETQDAFDRVRAKLEALDPASIREAVRARFEEFVGGLTLEALLPQAEIGQLDEAYQGIVDALRAVDPGKEIIDAVQPVFEAAIQPLLQVVARSSELIDGLVARLHGLAAELRQELARVVDAYGKMRGALPASVPAAA